MDVLESLNRVKWNFITLVIGIFSFINLKILANDFVEQYGNKVNVKNLLVTGYPAGTLKIIGLMLLTVAIFALTIYFAYTIGSSLFGLLQILLSLFFIGWAFALAWTPFIGTLFLMIVITVFIMIAVND